VPVPAAWANTLLPDIFTLREQLRTQAQASSKHRPAAAHASTGQQQA
jgi:hypothetical protein